MNYWNLQPENDKLFQKNNVIVVGEKFEEIEKVNCISLEKHEHFLKHHEE